MAATSKTSQTRREKREFELWTLAQRIVEEIDLATEGSYFMNRSEEGHLRREEEKAIHRYNYLQAVNITATMLWLHFMDEASALRELKRQFEKECENRDFLEFYKNIKYRLVPTNLNDIIMDMPNTTSL